KRGRRVFGTADAGAAIARNGATQGKTRWLSRIAQKLWVSLVFSFFYFSIDPPGVFVFLGSCAFFKIKRSNDNTDCKRN
ncbi:hypothetical protein, partial [Thermomonas sp.]|uniref:hypothetical protein n=1 Tax=Thermomonas sp. TaxID=1971895 RepID=UPI0026018F9E